MSGGEGSWPHDPMDPRCPECDGPVSATSSYCMHCEADLPSADLDATGASDGSDADFSTDVTEPDDRSGGTDTADGDRTTDTADGDRGWFHPDGLLDNVSTIGVGIGGGLVAGLLLTFVVVFPLPGGLPLLVGLVGWLAATAWIARTRTVFGAVRKAGYLVGGLLALLPVVVALSAPMEGGGVGSRLGFMFVLAIFVWPFAGGAVVVGFLGGLGRPDG